jgi:hypothetical protein
VAAWCCVRPEGAAPASPSISSTKVGALLPSPRSISLPWRQKVGWCGGI